ncbi:hypothetical protein [Pseudonocardia sp. EC080625-04]|uniref:hypothetical protein n=1 Tax=Pseudonocardia sp. EC080625-04 TaxID=1096868 RepID=UPI000A627858|nr:hypothetical protein [Pseudonocardia sp. EC080625-04]
MIEVEVHHLVKNNLSLIVGSNIIRAENNVLGRKGIQAPESPRERKLTGHHDEGATTVLGVTAAELEGVYRTPELEPSQQVATPTT